MSNTVQYQMISLLCNSDTTGSTSWLLFNSDTTDNTNWLLLNSDTTDSTSWLLFNSDTTGSTSWLLFNSDTTGSTSWLLTRPQNLISHHFNWDRVIQFSIFLFCRPMLVFSSFCFRHYIAWPSIFGSWLPLYYLPPFLPIFYIYFDNILNEDNQCKYHIDIIYLTYVSPDETLIGVWFLI